MKTSPQQTNGYEFEVFQRFKELSQGKTAVLISHRFTSVRMADWILVMVNGQVCRRTPKFPHP